MNNKKIFSQQHLVSSYECDTHKILSPIFMLKISEELADRNLRLYGLGYDQLLKKDTVYLLSGIRVDCFEDIPLGKEITISTAQRTIKGVRFVRDGVFFDGDKPLCQITQNWFLANYKTHSVVMPSDIEETKLVENAVLYSDETTIVKLPKKTFTVTDYVHAVGYADLDFNGHLNNTRYGEIMLSALGDVATERKVKSMSLVFVSEAKLGDNIAVSFEKTDDNTYYFSGEHPRGHCFNGEIIFK